jgi:hypothetical protein
VPSSAVLKIEIPACSVPYNEKGPQSNSYRSRITLRYPLLLTTDKNLRYQQNLADRKISIVVLGNSPWWLVRQHLERIALVVAEATPGSYAEVDIPFK